MRPSPASPVSAISPLFGPTKRTPSAAQRREIALRRRVIPHLRVHGGRDEDRLVGGKQHRRGKVVGATFGHAGENIGRRRRDHDQVGLAREAYVPDVMLVQPVEEFREHLVAGDRTDRERGDERFRRRGQDRLHIGAALAQPPDQVERFVEGDPAGDDEQDTLRAEHRVHAVHGFMTSMPQSSKSAVSRRSDGHSVRMRGNRRLSACPVFRWPPCLAPARIDLGVKAVPLRHRM